MLGGKKNKKEKKDKKEKADKKEKKDKKETKSVSASSSSSYVPPSLPQPLTKSSSASTGTRLQLS
jgi:hypothetical protein